MNEPALQFNLPLTAAIGMAPPPPSSMAASSASSSSEHEPQALGSERIELYGLKLADRVGPVLADLLKLNPDVKTVELQKNELTIEGLYEFFSLLRRHPSITHVNLWRNKLGDAGMSAISAAVFDSQLEHLDLNENGITAHGMKLFSICLPNNTKLVFLDVGYQGEHFGDEGLNYLLEGLSLQSSVTNLRLGGNGITDKGAQQFLTFLKAHPEVTDIDFDNNPVSAKLMQDLRDQITHYQSRPATSGQSVAADPRLFAASPAASSSSPAASSSGSTQHGVMQLRR